MTNTGTTEAVVSVTDLRKSYGSFTALDGVTFDIRRGETFALLGPNGGRQVDDHRDPRGIPHRSSGEAKVLGVDPQHGGLPWKARMGIVLQNTGETGNLTVREQLTHFAGFYANPRPVDEVITAVGLEAKAKTRIANFPAASAGEWMSRSASSDAPSCSSSTNPRPASIRRRGAASGTSSGCSSPRAPASS